MIVWCDRHGWAAIFRDWWLCDVQFKQIVNLISEGFLVSYGNRICWWPNCAVTCYVRVIEWEVRVVRPGFSVNTDGNWSKTLESLTCYSVREIGFGVLWEQVTRSVEFSSGMMSVLFMGSDFLSCEIWIVFGFALGEPCGFMLQFKGGMSLCTTNGPSQDTSRHLLSPGILFVHNIHWL